MMLSDYLDAIGASVPDHGIGVGILPVRSVPDGLGNVQHTNPHALTKSNFAPYPVWPVG